MPKHTSLQEVSRNLLKFYKDVREKSLYQSGLSLVLCRSQLSVCVLNLSYLFVFFSNKGIILMKSKACGSPGCSLHLPDLFLISSFTPSMQNLLLLHFPLSPAGTAAPGEESGLPAPFALANPTHLPGTLSFGSP